MPEVLVEGDDFYASPAPSPDGSVLAWISWRHPDMPWDRTELWLADLEPDGTLGQRSVASPAARARSRFASRGSRRTARSASSPIGPGTGTSTAASLAGASHARSRRSKPRSAARSGCSASRSTPSPAMTTSCWRPTMAGTWRLHRLRAGRLETAVRSLHRRPLRADRRPSAWCSSAPRRSSPRRWRRSRCARRPARDAAPVEILRRTSDDRGRPWLPVAPARDRASRPPAATALTASSTRRRTPRSRDRRVSVRRWWCSATADRPRRHRPRSRPASSSGPAAGSRSSTSTTAARPGSGARTARSSTASGEVAEVDDCVAAVRHLAAAGEIDPRRAVIRGASAGGYTTLAALAFRDTFRAGRELLRRRRSRGARRATPTSSSRAISIA